ncbi:solute:sodium symporter family transporter [Verrucomicrobiales bacterium]|nr:solute:sodium symporter family transporter [Verrucomicrobiales bacterium]MDC0048958.1 solute:sodium symporter family transporter [Verrucomicrobiota bacterium]
MIQIIAFLIFTGLVGFFSWRATRKDNQNTSTGYFLAGRSLPWIVVGCSLLLTNLSTEQLVGLNGGAFANGMQVMAWEVWSSIAIVLMALVFLPRYLKGGVATVSAFLERRYSKPVGTAVSVLLLLSLLTNLLPFVLYSGALFMIKVFNIEQILNIEHAQALWITVIALGVVGSLYAIFGGLKAVAISDTFNGIGLLFGGLLIPVLGLIYLGNEFGGGGGFRAGISYLTENHPERLSPIGKEDENIPFSTLFTGMLLITTYYWCTNQAIVQRTFASKSLAEGQKGVLFAAGMKLLGPLYLVLPGIIAWHMFGDTIQPDDSYGALVDKVLPAPLVGFFAAVIFGAILSSFNSSLNSAATLFSIDIYKGWIKKGATDQQMVKVGKFFGIVIAIGAIVLAPMIDVLKEAGFDGLFDLMKNLAALYNIPLLAVVFMGIFHKRVTSEGAMSAIIVGFVFWAYFGLFKENNLFGYEMHWLHLAAINFVLISTIMIVMAIINPREKAYEQTYTNDVDITPWKGAKACGIIILILIALMYWGMSFFGA